MKVYFSNTFPKRVRYKMSNSSKVDVLFFGRSHLQKIWNTFKKVVATGQAFRCKSAFVVPPHCGLSTANEVH